MTKRKSIITKLLLALVILTLISFCFLGNTFARYTSGGTGSATVQVAKWSVSFTNGDSTDVTFSKLSPDDADYVSTTEKRSHSTDSTALVTIKNEGDVSAKITFTLGDIVLNDSNGEIEKISGDDLNTNVTLDNVKSLFSIALDATDISYAEESGEYTLTLAANSEVAVTGVVTWTSHDELGEDAADAIDTWVGENVVSVSWTLTYTAVQVSELPEDNTQTP